MGGGIALGLNWVALFEAYRLLNVSLATLIYYIGPVLFLLSTPYLFREKLSGIKLAAAGLSLSDLFVLAAVLLQVA